MKLSLSTGSPAADVWLGTMTVIVFVLWLIAADVAAWLIRDSRRKRK